MLGKVSRIVRDWKLWEIGVLILLMQAAGWLTFFLLRRGFGP